MARSRSAKVLAQRVDREYFKKPSSAQRWLRGLALVGTACALLFVGWALVPENRLVWSQGPVSRSHRFIQEDCGVCHGALPNKIKLDARAADVRTSELQPLGGSAHQFGSVSDAKCAACHRGTEHQARQLTTPSCLSCHGEHGVVAAGEQRCTSCHAALHTKEGPSTKGSVTGFPEGHPEFAALRVPRDPGKLRLNHDVHLWPGLRGPDGPAPLNCLSCHVPDGTGRGFLAVKYDTHCAGCHSLTLPGNRLLDNTAVPHGDAVRAFVFVQALYGSAKEQEQGNALNEDPATAAFAQLKATTCARCHGASIANLAPGAPFEAVNVTSRWMPQARFAHQNHRVLGCGACHTGAEISRNTEDLLLPGKAICAKCHAPTRGAPSECADCHRYHPVDADLLGPGLFSLPE